jgi:hypothetical protein
VVVVVAEAAAVTALGTRLSTSGRGNRRPCGKPGRCWTSGCSGWMTGWALAVVAALALVLA